MRAPRKRPSRAPRKRVTRKTATIAAVAAVVTSVIIDKAVPLLVKLFQSKGL